MCKSLKYTFCRGFNFEYSLEFYYDDVTVTSFINIRYSSVAAESIP